MAGATGKPVKSFAVEIRLRNNQLKQRREELGMASGTFARAVGIAPGLYSGLECMRIFPMGARGWTQPALKIAEFHGLPPEELWPSEVLAVKKTAAELKLDKREVATLLASSVEVLPPEDLLAEKQLIENVRKAMKKLRPREAEVIERSFGIDCDEKTFAEIAEDLGVSPSRANEMGRRALNKICLSMQRERLDA